MARNRKNGGNPRLPRGKRRADAIDPEACAALIFMCQRALKWLTAAIMISILLVIAMTTLSTGTFVQIAGKGLYFTVVGAAITSVAIWSVRVRLQKRLGGDDLQHDS